jgi:drug/metabolite transporter (DMT)-like permease
VIGALYGILAAFSWGGGDFVGGIASRRLPTFFVVAASQSVALGILVPIALLSGQSLPDGATLQLTAIAGITGGTGVLSLYHGFAHGKISVVASIAGTLAALIPVAVALAGGETATPLRLAGFGLAIIAIYIVSTSADANTANAGDPGAHPDASSGAAAFGGALYGVAAGLCFAGFSLLFARVESESTLWLLTGLRVASVSALLSVFLIARAIGRRPPGAEEIRPGAIPAGRRGRIALVLTLAAAGSGDTLGNLFFLLASQESGVAVAAVFTSIAPVTTVLFAAVILRERIGLRQGIGILLAGAATLAIAAGGVV